MLLLPELLSCSYSNSLVEKGLASNRHQAMRRLKSQSPKWSNWFYDDDNDNGHDK